MNKTITILSFLCLTSCLQQQAEKQIAIKDKPLMRDTAQRMYPENKLACKVIETFLNEYINKGSLDSVLVLDEVRDWKIDENLEYSFDGESWLPKTEKER